MTIAVGERPAAVNDAYPVTLLGNVPINTASSTQFRVTANDRGDGKILAITGQSNGTATLNADSTFTFRPTPGHEGPASFTYTVTNGFGTSAAATVSMNVSGAVWFVNPTAAAGGDGRYDTPFNSLVALNAINNGAGSNPGAGDRIFLYTGTHTGPLQLMPQQQLIGQGAPGTFSTAAAVTWPADAGPEPSVAGGAPRIVATGANAVTLNTAGTSNTLRGLILGNVGATGKALSGTNFGTLTVASVAILTDGTALDLNAGTIDGSFLRVSSSGGASNVRLVDVGTAGTTMLGGLMDALSGATTDAFVVSGGSGTFTYPGAIQAATTARAVNVTNRTGGSLTFIGSINGSTPGGGIRVASNTGGTVKFQGQATRIGGSTSHGVEFTDNGAATTLEFVGGRLEVATTNRNAFHAVNGGVVLVSGTGNVLSSTGGTALHVANSAIGTGGLTFQSISGSGGANGILLQGTGVAGGLTVTGTGAAGSGGTIRNAAGPDGAAAGNGIYLENTRDIVLTDMLLGDHQNNGIFGTGVHGMAVNRMRITGSNGTASVFPYHESALQLRDVSGGLTFRNSVFNGGAHNAVLVRNDAGTGRVVDSLVFANDTVTTMQGSTADVRNTAIQAIFNDGTANVRIRDNHLTYWWGSAIDVMATGTGTVTSSITGNHAWQTSGALAASGGIRVAGGNHTYTVTGNSVRGTNGTAISADEAGNIASSMRGTIANNEIGQSGVANSGSFAGSGIFVGHAGAGASVTRVANNTIRQINGTTAITVQIGDAAAGGGNGTLDATIVGNDIQEEGTTANSGRLAIYTNIGTVGGDAPVACVAIGGTGAEENHIANFGMNRIRPNLRFNAAMRMPGYPGAPNSTPEVINYLRPRNDISGTAPTINVANSSTVGFQNAPAGCAQP